MTTLILESDLTLPTITKDAMFEHCMSLKGKVYRKVKNRETLQFTQHGEEYFIKKHFGVGWKEIFKSLVKLQWPVLGAENEYRAINHLANIGLSVPKIYGYGCRGWNPAQLQSFIILEALQHVMSINDLLLLWQKNGVDFKVKRILIRRIAEIVACMHRSGLNHRDCYLLHFLIDQRVSERDFDVENTPIYLIDLHRAQIRNKVPERWRIKDLAELYFSSMNIKLSKRDCFRFIKAYGQKNLRDSLKLENTFWLAIQNKATRLYAKRAIQ